MLSSLETLKALQPAQIFSLTQSHIFSYNSIKMSSTQDHNQAEIPQSQGSEAYRHTAQHSLGEETLVRDSPPASIAEKGSVPTQFQAMRQQSTLFNPFDTAHDDWMYDGYLAGVLEKGDGFGQLPQQATTSCCSYSSHFTAKWRAAGVSGASFLIKLVLTSDH